MEKLRPKFICTHMELCRIRAHGVSLVIGAWFSWGPLLRKSITAHYSDVYWQLQMETKTSAI